MAVVICNRYGPFYVAWYAFDVFANKVANKKKNWGKYRGTRKKAAAAGKARKKAKAEARREVKEDGKNYQTTTIVCRSNIKIKYIHIRSNIKYPKLKCRSRANCRYDSTTLQHKSCWADKCPRPKYSSCRAMLMMMMIS